MKAIADEVASADIPAAAERVEDEMVDAVTVYGTAEDWREKFNRNREADIALSRILPLHSDSSGCLPDPASHQGVNDTVDGLGPS